MYITELAGKVLVIISRAHIETQLKSRWHGAVLYCKLYGLVPKCHNSSYVSFVLPSGSVLGVVWIGLPRVECIGTQYRARPRH